MIIFCVSCGDVQEMILIKNIKESIENNTLPDNLLIFINTDKNSFLSEQYTKKISLIHKLPITYVEDINFINNKSLDIFGTEEVISNLRVYRCDEFLCTNLKLLSEKNIIIICNSISENTPKEFFDYSVSMPKLESWMIQDYVYSCAEGVDTKSLDWLIKLCNNNIFRLDEEISKISLFDESQRDTLFKEFISDSVFNDLSEHTIFSITNALQSKNKKELVKILPEIKNIDVEPVGFVKILWQNFKKIIDVWLNPNPTPENTGLKSNQLYAISKLPKVFTRDQLVSIFEIITSIDSRLKTGQIDSSLIVDYLIIKILSV